MNILEGALSHNVIIKHRSTTEQQQQAVCGVLTGDDVVKIKLWTLCINT